MSENNNNQNLNDLNINMENLSQQPIEYYYNINSTTRIPANITQFRERANEIGFTGRPIYKGKISKSYEKFLKKQFKDKYNLKSSPIKNNKIVKKIKKLETEGITYLPLVKKFIENDEPIKINLNGKSSIKTLLEQLLSNGKKGIIKLTTINGTQKTYTLNTQFIMNLQDSIINENDEEITSSGAEIINLLTRNTIETIEILPVNKTKPNGAFFKYINNIKELDLTDFQIYNSLDDIDKNEPCCFIKSLISAGVDELKISKAKELIKCRSIPTCKLNDLCINLQIHISINKLEDNKHIIIYPNGKTELEEIIRTKPVIKLGLIDEHYFHIKEVPITSFAINNYEEIKHIKDFHKIEKLKNGKPQKSNNRFIDSYKCIKLLYDNKETLLTPISLCDQVYSTQYYDLFNDIITLDYDKEKNTRKVIYKPKIDKFGDNYLNIFADFETTTDTEKHIAYLCCIYIDEVNICKGFIGDDCAKRMLNYIKTTYEGRNIRLIFHNAGYDIRFLYQYIYAYQPIERGKMLLRGNGFIYHNNKSIKIQIQDSYALIPDKLSNFKKMFGLEVKKEILPYGLYTRENVSKVCIDIDICKKYVEKQFINNNIGKKIDIEEQKLFVDEFMDNVKNWNCIIGDKINIIRYSQEYCSMDCKVLADGYNKFKQSIKDITYSSEEDEEGIIIEDYIDIDNYVSIASVALDYMKMEGVFNSVYELSGNVREFINKCMVGGRTMTCNNEKYSHNKNNNNNIVNEILADFDAVSLYPSAMERLKGYLIGRPKIIENTDYDNVKNYDGYFVEIVISDVNKKYKFPCMSKINKDGIREWTNNMINETIYVDKTTLEDLIKYHDIEFKIVRGYYYDEGRNMKLKPAIRKLFNKRLEAKAQENPIQNVYKLLMNSSYGKCLLKPIDTETKFVSNKQYKNFVDRNYNWIKDGEKVDGCDRWKFKLIKPINEHFNLVSCGVEVLSTSKSIMFEVMNTAEDLDISMYYTDTDSIHIDNSKIPILAEKYKKDYDRDLIGENMGQFHTDFDSDIIINSIMDKINTKNKTKLKFKELSKTDQEKYKKSILSKRSIFLGKKCYIDELYSEYADKVDYHIRLKGIPNTSILDYCYNNNLTPLELYGKLYEGEVITFDLTCGGKKINFKFNNDMTITTLDEFNRQIKFI